jgi:hypothetical protein
MPKTAPLPIARVKDKGRVKSLIGATEQVAEGGKSRSLVGLKPSSGRQINRGLIGTTEVVP